MSAAEPDPDRAGFGAAIFQTLRRFYPTDAISFTFLSNEFSGLTKGNDGIVRPYPPRSFSSPSVAEDENGKSRIFLGSSFVHFFFAMYPSPQHSFAAMFHLDLV